MYAGVEIQLLDTVATTQRVRGVLPPVNLISADEGHTLYMAKNVAKSQIYGAGNASISKSTV